MNVSYRRLSTASLANAVSDPTRRHIMPMSTLVASDEWLIEVSWNGTEIGDAQVFRNEACGPNGARMTKTVDGKSVPEPDRWVWFTGVTRGNIKNYKFEPEHALTPQTTDAQRKEEAKPAGAGGAKAA